MLQGYFSKMFAVHFNINLYILKVPPKTYVFHTYHTRFHIIYIERKTKIYNKI